MAKFVLRQINHFKNPIKS